MTGKKVKSPHGLGARYGRTVRKRSAELEFSLRRKHICPKCNSKSVKRIFVGVWKCHKCDLTFSGGAYTPTSKIGEVARRSVSRGT